MQPYPYLHIRNKEFPWGMFCNIDKISLLFSLANKSKEIVHYFMPIVNFDWT